MQTTVIEMYHHVLNAPAEKNPAVDDECSGNLFAFISKTISSTIKSQLQTHEVNTAQRSQFWGRTGKRSATGRAPLA